MTGLFNIVGLILSIFGNLADCLSTYPAVKKFGIQIEINPIGRGFMELIGIVPALILKFIGFSILFFFIYKSVPVINWILVGYFIYFVYNNLKHFKEFSKKEEQ